MPYQGKERRQTDEVQGLAELSIETETPVDQLTLQRATDVGREDELRAAVKGKLPGLAGYTTEKVAAELSLVITAGAEAADAAREAQPSRLLSFAESEAFLKEHGIDLGKTREDDVRSMIRWGALDKKGADAYGAKFDEVQIPECDLQELVRRLEAEPDLEQRVILGLDSLTPDQGFQKLFVEAGIRHYIYRRFSEYQRVDAKTRQPLQNQRPSGKAGILFTANHLNLPANLRKISPNDQLTKMANGQKYVGPVGWMKLFRQSVDRALPILYPEEAGNLDSLKPGKYKALVQKALLDPRIDQYLPDVTTGTQFPDLRHKDDGAVPFLNFDPDAGHREVALDDGHPVHPNGSLGGRDALGTFLS